MIPRMTDGQDAESIIRIAAPHQLSLHEDDCSLLA